MSDLATIFGFGGQARVVRALLDNRYRAFEFVTTAGVSDTLIEDEWFAERAEPSDVYVAIGDNAARKRIHDRLVSLGIVPATCIADSAVVAYDAIIGAGSVICAGAVVMASATIGEGVIVNTLSSVDHDCDVGDHAQITAGVTLGGATAVGRSCYLGIKSATMPGVTIGDGSVVMAGSVVTRDVPANVMVGSIPARIVRRLSDGRDGPSRIEGPS